MNKSLLLKVKAHILEEPRRIWMSVVQRDITKQSLVASHWERDKSYSRIRNKPPCGTVGCIAGWTNILSGLEKLGLKRMSDMDKAASALGITWNQKNTLFFVDTWPEPYRSRYPKCRTAKQRAKCVADRIDAFIESEGEV